MPTPTISRERILAVLTATTRARHGLAELSMDELAAAAGVSRATLYRLVPGKEALFAALVRSFSPFEPVAAVLEATGDRPPAEVIPAVAHAMATAMDGQMAAGRLRRMEPVLAFEALAGPIVMHLLWRAPAASRVDGPLARAGPLQEVVDGLVGVWLRAMATDQQATHETASAPPRPRSERHDRADTGQAPRRRP